MIVLHAGYLAERLLLWGEMPREADPRPARRGGRRASLPPLPYDADLDALSAAMKKAGLGFSATGRNASGAVAWLPTAGNEAVASSPLVAEPPKARSTITIAPWKITACRLSPERTVDLLCACVEKETLAPGVVVGADLAFWATAMRLAGATVARQKFLPDVVLENGTWYARWKPVLAGPDAQALGKLAAAMPAVARALTLEG
ncbi:MAG: ATP-dependent helicase, partial [Deltaproteobacteria bacterium]|nr:ATP-dependent helicase [Deltaproteobacteria bacterium]